MCEDALPDEEPPGAAGVNSCLPTAVTAAAAGAVSQLGPQGSLGGGWAPPPANAAYGDPTVAEGSAACLLLLVCSWGDGRCSAVASAANLVYDAAAAAAATTVSRLSAGPACVVIAVACDRSCECVARGRSCVIALTPPTSHTESWLPCCPAAAQHAPSPSLSASCDPPLAQPTGHVLA